METFVAAGKAEVEAQLKMVRVRRKALKGDEPLDETLAKLTNSLTKSIAALSAEQRQLEKHTSLRLERLSDEDEDAIIQEALSEMSRPRRHKHFELLKALEDDNDLLSL